MRRTVIVSRASSEYTKNGITYYFHGIYDDFTQSWTHCMLSEYIVEKSKYRDFLLIEFRNIDEYILWKKENGFS